MNNLFVSSYGLGRALFSSGMHDLAVSVAGKPTWSSLTVNASNANTVLKAIQADDYDHIAIAGHSAGCSLINRVAKSADIDIAFYIDNWLPFQKVPDRISRSISFKASTFGRFHTKGADELIDVNATHTTIDDNSSVMSRVHAELNKLIS